MPERLWQTTTTTEEMEKRGDRVGEVDQAIVITVGSVEARGRSASGEKKAETHGDQKASRSLRGLLAEGGVRNVVEIDGPLVRARLGRSAGGIPEIEVFQYALDHLGVSDDAYDTHRSATAGTPERVVTTTSSAPARQFANTPGRGGRYDPLPYPTVTLFPSIRRPLSPR